MNYLYIGGWSGGDDDGEQWLVVLQFFWKLLLKLNQTYRKNVWIKK